MKGLLFDQKVELFKAIYANENEALFIAKSFSDMREHLRHDLARGTVGLVTADWSDVKRLINMEDALIVLLSMTFHPSVFDAPTNKVIRLGRLKSK